MELKMGTQLQYVNTQKALLKFDIREIGMGLIFENNMEQSIQEWTK